MPISLYKGPHLTSPSQTSSRPLRFPPNLPPPPPLRLPLPPIRLNRVLPLRPRRLLRRHPNRLIALTILPQLGQEVLVVAQPALTVRQVRGLQFRAEAREELVRGGRDVVH